MKKQTRITINLRVPVTLTLDVVKDTEGWDIEGVRDVEIPARSLVKEAIGEDDYREIDRIAEATWKAEQKLARWKR